MLKTLKWYLRGVCLSILWVQIMVLSVQAQTTQIPADSQTANNQSERVKKDLLLSQEVESVKQAALELNRDLSILEEDLLFPANTQIAVFVSLDVGQYFQLDSIKLKIDDKLVASHLYSDRQSEALIRGGVQRLYLGNLKTGSHELTAFFHGFGPQEREYKRGATYQLNKDQTPAMLEIKIMDAKRNMQPKFEFKEWKL